MTVRLALVDDGLAGTGRDSRGRPAGAGQRLLEGSAGVRTARRTGRGGVDETPDGVVVAADETTTPERTAASATEAPWPSWTENENTPAAATDAAARWMKARVRTESPPKLSRK